MSDQYPPPPPGDPNVPPPPPPGGYTPPPPPPAYGAPQGGYVAPPPGYAYPTYGAAPVGNKKALWSMVLGILGITICCGLIGVVMGIVALVLGNQAKTEIASSGGMQTGEGQAQAGVIMGGLAIALGIVATIAYVSIVINRS